MFWLHFEGALIFSSVYTQPLFLATEQKKNPEVKKYNQLEKSVDSFCKNKNKPTRKEGNHLVKIWKTSSLNK